MPDGRARKRPQIDVDSQVRELNLDGSYDSAFEERLTPDLAPMGTTVDSSFCAVGCAVRPCPNRRSGRLYCALAEIVRAVPRVHHRRP